MTEARTASLAVLPELEDVPVGIFEPRAPRAAVVLGDSIDRLHFREVVLFEHDPAIAKLSDSGLDVLHLEPHARALARPGKLRPVDQEPRTALGLIPDTSPVPFVAGREPEHAAIELLGPAKILDSDHGMRAGRLQHQCHLPLLS